MWFIVFVVLEQNKCYGLKLQSGIYYYVSTNKRNELPNNDVGILRKNSLSE